MTKATTFPPPATTSRTYHFERVVPAGLPVNGSDQEILVRDQLIYRLATADE